LGERAHRVCSPVESIGGVAPIPPNIHPTFGVRPDGVAASGRSEPARAQSPVALPLRLPRPRVSDDAVGWRPSCITNSGRGGSTSSNLRRDFLRAQPNVRRRPDLTARGERPYKIPTTVRESATAGRPPTRRSAAQVGWSRVRKCR
jgi:hypothetical protein